MLKYYFPKSLKLTEVFELYWSLIILSSQMKKTDQRNYNLFVLIDKKI